MGKKIERIDFSIRSTFRFHIKFLRLVNHSPVLLALFHFLYLQQVSFLYASFAPFFTAHLMIKYNAIKITIAVPPLMPNSFHIIQSSKFRFLSFKNWNLTFSFMSINKQQNKHNKPYPPCDPTAYSLILDIYDYSNNKRN